MAAGGGFIQSFQDMANVIEDFVKNPLLKLKYFPPTLYMLRRFRPPWNGAILLWVISGSSASISALAFITQNIVQ